MIFFVLFHGIYRGPISSNSKFAGVHALVIQNVRMIDGKTIFKCKNSHGLDSNDRGYLLVSASTYVMGAHYKPARAKHPNLGILVEDDKVQLKQSGPLIGSFYRPR